MVSTAASLLGAPVRDAVGGGFLAPGPRGEYFANSDLSGSASFDRAEVRLDFDWGTFLPVGGSIAEPYRSFPRDHFSVRFSGQVMPAFSETYTFKLIADDGARLFLRPAGTGEWIPVIDAWAQAGTVLGTWSMERGTVYDVRVEYRELTGDARLRLLWSAPSCPEEVIDPVAQVGFNQVAWRQTFADVTQCGRNVFDVFGNGAVPQDAQGWPLNDCIYVMQETLNQGLDLDPLLEGRVTFSFNGRADLTIIGNLNRNSLVYSYDAAENRTSGSFLALPQSWNVVTIGFTNSDRDGQQPPRRNGITNLRLMRPVSPGANTSYPESALFIGEMKRALEYFTVLRVDLNNASQESHWSDRTLPSFFNQSNGSRVPCVYPPDNGPVNNGPSWEYSIMLCNETGRDLYINVPLMATGWEPGDTGAYVNKLARLIKYGSDGVEPYNQPVANPVYPPLNPNLRVYVEMSNEVWNFGGNAFRQSIEAMRLVQADGEAYLDGKNTDPRARGVDFPILNYDNLSTARQANGEFVSVGTWRMRKVMLRILQVSNIFRAEFGDAVMHTRVRPVYEWQYADLNGTASGQLAFADDYFNNGNGRNNVAIPRPVSYYLWGGGGATYYGAANPYGVTNQISDPGFEQPVLPDGYHQTPAGSSWTFSGTAGIARDGGGSDDIPPPAAGGQMAYIDGTGAIEVSVPIPATQTSNRYAFVFRAVQRVRSGTTTPDGQKLTLSVNGLAQNARSFNQSGGYQPVAWNSQFPWESHVVFWSRGTTYYSSLAFEAAPGSTVTLRLAGTAAPGNVAFVEDVRLGSVDTLFDSGLPGGGEAFGQPPGTNFRQGLNAQGSWAFAYGLNYIAYEGGWSLGSDTGGSGMQNYAKYFDPRAGDANSRALEAFQLSGGTVNTLGTYAQWSNWADLTRMEGLLSLETNPLLVGQLSRMRALPPLPDNGIRLPAILSLGAANLARNRSGNNLNAAGWASWNMIAPVTGRYRIDLDGVSGNTWRMLLNDSEEIGRTDSGAAVEVELTRGLHTLKLRGGTSVTTVASLTVSMVGAPSVPEITGIMDRDLAFEVTWTAATGATGYVLSWGTSPGAWTNSLTTTANSGRVSGLVHNTQYFFSVRALNGALTSLPSEERGAIALQPDQVGVLAAWDLQAAGSINGDAQSVRPTVVAGKVEAGSIKRGGAYYPVQLIRSNSGGLLDGESNFLITTKESARNLDYYFEWEVAPSGGSALNLSTLRLFAYDGSSILGSKVAVDALVDGVADPVVVGEVALSAASYAPNELVYSLGGIPALQGVTGRVRFRAYFYGMQLYAHRGIGMVPGNNADVEIQGSVTAVTLPETSQPLVSLLPGSYGTSRTVRITHPFPDATIRFTVDGSAPTAGNGLTYSGPLQTAAGAMQLRAYAVRPGFAPSGVVASSWEFSAASGAVVVESDFSGTSPALNLPWTKTKQVAPGVTFGGWTFGRFQASGGFDQIFGHEGNDGLVFSHILDGEVTLARNLADRKYLTATVEFAHPVDLRGSTVDFTVHRLDGHAPTRVACLTSIGGFASGRELFSSYRSPVTATPTSYRFRFPYEPAYAAVSGPVEVRLCFFDGAFAFHRARFSAFRWALRPVPPSPGLAITGLPQGRVGAGFAAALEPVGIAPLQVEASGPLPDGMAVRSENTLSGRPRLAGDFVIPIRITDADGMDGSASVPWTVVSPFAEWRARQGLPSGFPEGMDPEDVGIPALLRHALAVDHGWDGLPWGTRESGHSNFHLRRALGATDTVIEIWRSEDLNDWELVYEIAPEGEAAKNGFAAPVDRHVAGQVETMTFQVEGATPEQPVFLRVRVAKWE